MIKLFDIHRNEDSRIRHINPKLIYPKNSALRWILLGNTGCGKSTIIKNVLFNTDWGYMKYYDEVYYFIGSLDDYVELSQFIKRYKMGNKVMLTTRMNMDEIKKLLDEIEQSNIKSPNPSNSLFIFDDKICDNLSSSYKQNVIDELFIRGRHARISCIISTQKYKSISQNLRTLNCSALTLFFGTGKIDIENVAEEYSNHLTKKEMIQLINNNVRQPHDFITFDKVKNRILNSNFDEI